MSEGGSVMERNLDRIQVKREAGSGRWEVWVPVRGPMVDHVPLHERFDVTPQPTYTPEEEAEAYEYSNQLGPYGTSYWLTLDEALDFLRRVLTSTSVTRGEG